MQYNRGRWRQRSLAYRRDHPLCERCQSRGRTRIAVEVDHIVPRWRGGDDSDANLQALCQDCHAEKTRLDLSRQGVGADGIPYARQRLDRPRSHSRYPNTRRPS